MDTHTSAPVEAMWDVRAAAHHRGGGEGKGEAATPFAASLFVCVDLGIPLNEYHSNSPGRLKRGGCGERKTEWREAFG